MKLNPKAIALICCSLAGAAVGGAAGMAYSDYLAALTDGEPAWFIVLASLGGMLIAMCLFAVPLSLIRLATYDRQAASAGKRRLSRMREEIDNLMIRQSREAGSSKPEGRASPPAPPLGD